MCSKKRKWGGPWTEKKLDAFSKYVSSYLRIMKRNPYWKTIYFDGFAGSGVIENDLELAQLEITIEEQAVYRGAAERVLSLPDNLAFDYTYFIEKDEVALQALMEHLESKDLQSVSIREFRKGNCNIQLRKLAKALNGSTEYTSLIFLDPFGMQITWESISCLYNTRSDIWILVPTGVIVNRLLDKKKELKSYKKLESFFGLPAKDIQEHFYSESKTVNLFGEEETEIVKIVKPIEKIVKLYQERLSTIWKFVSKNPLVLKNSKSVPIFHLVFASNNQNAVKIASQIIEKN